MNSTLIILQELFNISARNDFLLAEGGWDKLKYIYIYICSAGGNVLNSNILLIPQVKYKKIQPLLALSELQITSEK